MEKENPFFPINRLPEVPAVYNYWHSLETIKTRNLHMISRNLYSGHRSYIDSTNCLPSIVMLDSKKTCFNPLTLMSF